MPSSDITTVPKVVNLVMALQPRTILDVGCGNGRYGFLFRECLDLNYGRLLKDKWSVIIDAVEVERQYITDVHHFSYTNVYISDWMDFEPKFRYEFLLMGDVLEHFDDWENALKKANDCSDVTMVVAPNWPGSISQGAWCGHASEIHRVALSPKMVGGRCIFANSKIFISVFDNNHTGIFDGKDFSL